MAGAPGGGPARDEPPTNGCPNCGSPLEAREGVAGRSCAACGWSDSVPSEEPAAQESAPDAGPVKPTLVRAEVLAATKKQLQDLCRAYGLKVSGNKTTVLTRILRYMDEHGIDVPPDDVEVPDVVEPAEAAPTPTPSPAAEATRHPEAEAAIEDILLAVEREPVVETPVFLPASPERLRRDRRRFYVGVAFTAVGGFGLLFGSFLHDALRVPVFGQAYGVFGPLNAIAASLGALLLLAGLVGLGLGLRGGVVREAVPQG